MKDSATSSFFSIVISLYNKENYIVATLNSVLKQTFSDFEVIIINDGSTDNSESLVKAIKDSRIKLVTTKNKGVSSARNHGISLAKSNNIALLDADDYWYSNHLFELKKLMDIFPDAGLYCNNYEIHHTQSIVRPARFNFDFGKACLLLDDFFMASIINGVAWTSAVGFKKNKFNTLGGFNPSLATGQDTDLWIRFALKHEIAFNPVITASYLSYVENSLFKNEYNAMRYDIINSYSQEEQTNPSLKKYLDVNRYAVALRCKMHNDQDIYKKLKSEIEYSHLNVKQQFLLSCPKFILSWIKKCHGFLLKKDVYLTAYR
ncbi:glycosyltransferase [Lacinutrix neustonica]|uniref:Glycosyltransferase n=1 Tax=Lacinutrix neustonica TaxID=2980107 RepID=A0A9E8MX91_9FLAO|nr:glycosyltransferase [Lacinutrix neustonica]WAC03343.1 glycosyltransferase [Lacinutrix neustonica]